MTKFPFYIQNFEYKLKSKIDYLRIYFKKVLLPYIIHSVTKEYGEQLSLYCSIKIAISNKRLKKVFLRGIL